MRLHVGAIPESADFQPEAEGWHSLHKLRGLEIWAPFVALGIVMLVICLWGELVPWRPIRNGILAMSGIVLVALLFSPLHELPHALAAPGWGLSEKTVFLFNPPVTLFAHYEGSMARNRYLLVLAAPLIVWTLLPLPIAGVWNRATGDGAVAAVLLTLSVMNGMVAYGDLLLFATVWKQVPRQALVRYQGGRTWWKPIV